MKFVPQALERAAARQMLQVGKSSPTLLLGAGVIGMIGTTVLACRATLRVEEVLSKAQNDLGGAKELERTDPTGEYTKSDLQKDTAVIYARAAVGLGKLYGPAIVLGAASVGMLAKSHNILAQRNSALTAAYVAVEQAFREYRSRVVEKYGEEQDQEFRYATEEVELLDDRGKIRTEKRVSPDADSMYARWFDEESKEWNREPEYNIAFLRCQQTYWNDTLRTRGYVFLNEVYKELGIEMTTAGAVVGWIYSPENHGDNYIDFGIFNGENSIRELMNGREGAILLDFNVDGVIYDQIESRR